MIDALRIGASGLSAAQRGVDVAAHNTANAATPGYTRTRVELLAATPSRGVHGMAGTGVQVGALTRLRDAPADSAYRASAAKAGAGAAAAELLTRVQDLLGPIDSGLPAALTSLYDAAATLALRPNDPAAREGFLGAAGALARSFSDLARGIDAIGPDVAGKATDLVARTNTLTAHVAALNVEIAEATTRGEVPADLLDARDRALDELSQIAGARVGTPDAQGRVAVYVGSQPVVRDGASYPLVAGGTPGALTIGFADGQVAQVGGGSLGGLLDAQAKLAGIRSGLDELATGIAEQFNEVHTAGFDLDGNPGQALFTGTSAATLVVNPGLDARGVAASASGAPNDGNNALALSALRDAQAADGTTAAGRLGAWVASIGLTVSDAKLQAKTAADVTGSLEAARTSLHAVSVDEEMVDMIRFQRAYQAAARVVTVADQMLEHLINRMGV